MGSAMALARYGWGTHWLPGTRMPGWTGFSKGGGETAAEAASEPWWPVGLEAPGPSSELGAPLQLLSLPRQCAEGQLERRGGVSRGTGKGEGLGKQVGVEPGGGGLQCSPSTAALRAAPRPCPGLSLVPQGQWEMKAFWRF